MKQIFSVFAFTFKNGARQKTFIITTVIILAIILVACSVPRVLLSFTGGNIEDIVTGKFYTCYYIDETGKLNGGELLLADKLTDTEFIVATPEDKDRIISDIASDAKTALILIANGEDGKPAITISAKDFLNRAAANSGDIASVLSKLYATRVMEELGIGAEIIADAQRQIPCTVNTEGGLTPSGYAAGILLITLTFFAVYYYGYGVASSVASEKSSRVMETLIVSAKPSYILIGKCLGMGILGLCQFGGILIFTALCWKLLIPPDFTVMGTALSLTAFTPRSVFLIIVFFILGYTLYAMMNAVCGATIDKLDELNAAMMPVMLISMGSFYLSYFTAMMGTTYDYLVNLSMYIPFSAPFIMPFVLLNGEVAGWQILLSAGILVVTIVIVAAISIRIYNASVMHYGKRLKLTEAIKKRKSK